MEEVHTLYKCRIAFGEKLQSAGEWFGKGCEGNSFVMAILFVGPSGFCCDVHHPKSNLETKRDFTMTLVFVKTW